MQWSAANIASSAPVAGLTTARLWSSAASHH